MTTPGFVIVDQVADAAVAHATTMHAAGALADRLAKVDHADGTKHAHSVLPHDQYAQNVERELGRLRIALNDPRTLRAQVVSA